MPTKKNKKEVRRVAREERKTKKLEKRQELTKRLLEKLDLWDLVKDSYFKDYLLKLHYPVPKIIAGNLPENEQSNEIIRMLQSAIKDTKFDAPLLGNSFSVISFYSAVMPILHFFETISVESNLCSRKLKIAIEKTTELGSDETTAQALLTLFCDVALVLAIHGRVDSLLYYFDEIHEINLDKKYFVEITIHAIVQREKKFTLAKGDRKAFKCGRPNRFSGIEWIQLNGSVIQENPRRKYPVFIQSHALDQMYKRVSETNHGHWVTHDDLLRSLLDPQIVEKQGHEFLIEYRWLGFKIGYLTATVIDECVIISTFLFLTMDGTPEGKLLEKKLKLERLDKEFLGLDKMETYLRSDLGSDPDIVKLLSECGCEHLFKLPVIPTPQGYIVTGCADDFRKHLQLDRKN